MTARIYAADRVFDGRRLWRDAALVTQDGQITRIVPRAHLRGTDVTELGAGVIAPGFVDLQVNGGGGAMFCETPDVATLRLMAEAHASLGSLHLLPTVITASPQVTAAAIASVIEAQDSVPGISGLHLEGPHLEPARAGAHDPALIRPMTDTDLALYLDAARRLRVLKITLAPEAATRAQIRALVSAGVVVSLGHSDCSFEAAAQAFGAGASCVTHLFNAMSPLQGRAPGLVGAALAHRVAVGMIADGIHVSPTSLSLALRAKSGMGHAFLVSDAMAVAGTKQDRFTLNGREILREGGRLTLPDGTLAGADLSLPQAVRVMVDQVGLPLDAALAMATSIPAEAAGLAHGAGRLSEGCPADFVWLDDDLTLRGVWRAGTALELV